MPLTRLKCGTCGHEWNEDVKPGVSSVLCPECIGTVPVTSIVGDGDPGGTAAPSNDVSHTAPAPIPSSESPTKLISDKSPEIAVQSGGSSSTPEPEPGDSMAETVEIDRDRKKAATLAKPSSSSKRRARRDDIAANDDVLIGNTINGLRFEKKLGQGGMGAVYLAHQISLDRQVAVKVLPPGLAQKPELVARFTREALSAARLNHHNVVGVYDVGEHNGLHYITMEFVKGKNLGQVVRGDGPLRVDDAASYCLQTARGLDYAHNRGIIHRDIKPDNLMVNEHGIVKIADMGLAKMLSNPDKSVRLADYETELKGMDPAGNLTMADIAMGTPAYMPPEQAQDTASVDHRADQYSLGCTIYYMCAGRAPYSGTTAFELISKHMKEPVTPLETVVKGVPPAFSHILEKMLSKRPEDRYESLGEVATALESYLGVENQDGAYRPRDAHLAVLEDCVKKYYAAGPLKLRKLLVPAFFMIVPFLTIFTLFSGSILSAVALFSMLFLIPAFTIIINGMLDKTHLYRRLRGTLFGMKFMSWVKTILGTIATVGFLYITNTLAPVLSVAVTALGIAFAYRFAIIRPLKKKREEVILKNYNLLRDLRIRGVSEDQLRDFVSRFAGPHWEEFFEEFFTYDEKLEARAKWASTDQVKPRKKFATWREPILAYLDNLEAARKEAKDKKTLEKAELERLKAEGFSEKDAKLKAEEEASTAFQAGGALDTSTPLSRDDIVSGKKRSLKVFGKVGLVLRLLRAVVAIVLLVGASPGVPVLGAFVPEVIPQQFNSIGYYSWGYGTHPFAFLAGLLLLPMVLSSRAMLSTLGLLGGLLIIFAAKLGAATGSAYLGSEFLVTGAGVILCGAAFGFAFMAKMSKGKF